MNRIENNNDFISKIDVFYSIYGFAQLNARFSRHKVHLSRFFYYQ